MSGLEGCVSQDNPWGFFSCPGQSDAAWRRRGARGCPFHGAGAGLSSSYSATAEGAGGATNERARALPGHARGFQRGASAWRCSPRAALLLPRHGHATFVFTGRNKITFLCDRAEFNYFCL